MQIQITDLLESYIENIEDTELAVLLSGGVDSLSVAFAADRVGKRISTYSFRLDIHDNYDNEKAQQAANEFGWAHRECVVDTTNLVEDFLRSNQDFCKEKNITKSNFYTQTKNAQSSSKQIDVLLDKYYERKQISIDKMRFGLTDKGKLKKHPLISYGNHTYNHYVLSSLTKEEQEIEIRENQKLIKNLDNNYT